MARHEFSVKRFVLPRIRDGSKSLEVRLGYDRFRRVAVGDEVVFQNRINRVNARVVAIREYRSFKEMLETENHFKIMPEWRKPEIHDALLEHLKGDVSRLGVLVFEFELIR